MFPKHALVAKAITKGVRMGKSPDYTASKGLRTVWHTNKNAILIIARVHNKRREGEYPTSIVWANALHKVMM